MKKLLISLVIMDSDEHKKYNVGMSGHIALQLHKNSENKIWFKDNEIRKN